jgi:hypothetical protein
MPITIRNSDIPAAFKALQALDGAPSVVEIDTEDGKKRSMLHTTPYVFGGKARFQIAKWLIAIKTTAEALTKTHDGLVKQYAEPAKPDQVTEANMPAWREEWLKVQDDVSGFDLHPIKLDELKVEDNRIPSTVLAALLPLLAE